MMIDLKLESMTSRHCVKPVTAVFAEIPGVKGPSEVSLDQVTAGVERAPDLDVLLTAVKGAGYSRSHVSGSHWQAALARSQLSE